ncbi:phosphoglycolate phosphatase 1A, chloroplastic-like [Leguminivora glycinivorella]|uniref:phosphoglycolate phosphatase 1A, chloroplastic-like n=1 Tax=Leguminivora glycinivorella TaxID=1035111 RepID=UPI00200DBCFD|nr:phosphoglycolate phosphatase 1A, chloroplastic-like [Leguminivora glycinivorella]
MAPVNLFEVNSDGFKQFLESFDHVFSDCDGVLWLTEALPGVGDFIRLMKENGKTVNFVSNNSMRSKENYTKMFDNAGIPDGFENLTTPSVAMVEYLKSVNFDKHVFCLTCPETKKMLEINGFKTKYGPDVTYDSFADFADYLIDDADIGAVAFDSDYKVNLPKMYKAATYLKRPEVLFMNGPTDRYVPFRGQMSIGASFATDLVSELVKREPIGLGKPSKDFGVFAMRRAWVTDPSRVLFIGDMIEQDVGLGKNTGFKTLLVLTHCTEDEMKAEPLARQPDFFAPSLGSLVPKFIE